MKPNVCVSVLVDTVKEVDKLTCDDVIVFWGELIMSLKITQQRDSLRQLTL
jgi:hypothetical protein